MDQADAVHRIAGRLQSTANGGLAHRRIDGCLVGAQMLLELADANPLGGIGQRLAVSGQFLDGFADR